MVTDMAEVKAVLVYTEGGHCGEIVVGFKTSFGQGKVTRIRAFTSVEVMDAFIKQEGG
jgi:hypothetical protein